ncbi:MAG: hypothetical protein EA001_05245 [Oscillatoriales cyanobacterium]|nr:MAG: hypothetical protein EA001_05245 [Oscillatoriales cyanobacterium]
MRAIEVLRQSCQIFVPRFFTQSFAQGMLNRLAVNESCQLGPDGYKTQARAIARRSPSQGVMELRRVLMF